MLKRPAKLMEPLNTIWQLERQGLYDFVSHARERLQQREVTVQEVLQVLRHGHYEAKKDEFREDFKEWNYAVKGKTLDSRALRLAVAIKPDGFLVITVIDLDKK